MPVKVFSAACLPPAAYFVEILSAEEIIIDLAEHFIRQTSRSRYTILSSNGPLIMTIPIQHPASNKAMCDVRISYQDDWIRKHFQSLRSAYGRSAYYAFLNQDVVDILNKKHTFLIDLNLELLNWTFRILKISPSITFSKTYIESVDANFDLRKSLPRLQSMPYYQVFSDKFGFVPQLSVLDLIFNSGPASLSLLKS